MGTLIKHLHFTLGIGFLSVFSVFGLPSIPTTPDILCSEKPDTTEVASTAIDAEGFSTVFDGATAKGLWQCCGSGHTADKTLGAVWKIDPVEHTVYSTRRGTDGGLFFTKKKYGNYEVIFDIWPGFGNDGGFFNRADEKGVCYQTVMDYLGSGSFGGSWPEQQHQGNRDIRPTTYTGNTPQEINTYGKDPADSWTDFTAKTHPAYLKLPTAADLGCVSSGCVAADWNRMWDFNGWIQVRIKFYGGTKTGTGKVHMISYFKKPSATVWTPILVDSNDHIDPPNYVGFQVHTGGRFGDDHGNWYRNWKIRPLDDQGNPLGVSKIVESPSFKPFEINATTKSISGIITEDYEIKIRDLQGREIEAFSGPAGKMNYTFKTTFSGVITLEIKTANGVTNQRLNRP